VQYKINEEEEIRSKSIKSKRPGEIIKITYKREIKVIESSTIESL
jgi:hypothetical protein